MVGAWLLQLLPEGPKSQTGLEMVGLLIRNHIGHSVHFVCQSDAWQCRDPGSCTQTFRPVTKGPSDLFYRFVPGRRQRRLEFSNVTLSCPVSTRSFPGGRSRSRGDLSNATPSRLYVASNPSNTDSWSSTGKRQPHHRLPTPLYSFAAAPVGKFVEEVVLYAESKSLPWLGSLFLAVGRTLLSLRGSPTGT